MFRIEVHSNDFPIKNNESILSLIQSQMAAIGSPRSAEQVNKAIANAFSLGSRAVLFLGYAGKNVPVAFAFGNVCAGLEAGADYFWLNELFVDISCRRHGYAHKLLKFIEDWLSHKGIKYMACAAGEMNTPAQNMYQKNGFELSRIIWVDKQV